jgi:hypothetical protein
MANLHILEEETRVDTTLYYRDFHMADNPDIRWSFPCDADGNVDTATLDATALGDFHDCHAGVMLIDDRRVDIIDDGVRTSRTTHVEFGGGTCPYCGRWVWLVKPFFNTCECGERFNKQGHLIRPRQTENNDG